MSHYRTLGVPMDATQLQIKKAYRRIVAQTHPDRHGDDPDKRRAFESATKAYAILSDPTKRRAYDRERRPAASLQVLLGRLIGEEVMDRLSPPVPAAPRKGAHRIRVVDVHDGQITLEADGSDSALTVPAPTQHRMVRVTGRGTAGHAGADSGDLFLIPTLTTDKESP